jgi:predicted nucleic acid-binding protein
MVLVDSNVLLDWLTNDRVWFGWSSKALFAAQANEGVAINPIVYAEVSVGYLAAADVEKALPPDQFNWLGLPYDAAFVAGKTYVQYRRKGGTRRSPLPDFFIGAHAQVDGLTLLTRDATRFRTYFPSVNLIAP